MACLAALAFVADARAGLIEFYNVQFDVSAAAVTDGPAGGDSQSSPPSATPVSVAVDSIGSNAVATAGAIGGAGLLTTSADASAGSGIASAVATSHFSGWFDNLGPLNLAVDFLPVDSAVDSGSATTSLYVLLISDGTTLFDGFVDSALSFWIYPTTAGTSTFLDITLTSDALAGFPNDASGGASAFGLVGFAATIPTPGALVLVLIGLAAVATSRTGVRRRFGIA